MPIEQITPQLLAALAEPFSSDVIHWRVGSTTKDNKRGMALAYVDARDVMNRLDQVCGGAWQDHYQEVCGRVVCCISIHNQTRSDGAGDTQVEAEKGGLSDAFKRAAVKWGVARYLYSLPNTWVQLDGNRKIVAPPSLPPWALPQGVVSEQEIDFAATETTPAEVSNTQHELINAIKDTESVLISHNHLDIPKRDVARKKYMQVTELLSASEAQLAAYYDELVAFMVIKECKEAKK